MASFTSYHGIQVLTPPPVGDGGLKLQDDLKTIVDWNPKSLWNQTADPGVSNDQSQDYYPGSLWLRTDTTPLRLFVCKTSSTGAAVWQRIPLPEVAQTADPGASNDQTQGYYLGSVWLRTNTTPPRLFVCQSASTGAAVWLRIPLPEVAQTADPGVSNDQTQGYYLGSLWLRTNTTPPRLFVCQSASTGAAVWQRIQLPEAAIVTKTAAYTLTAQDETVLADAATAAFTITLPTAVGIKGRQYFIKRINSGANAVTVGTTSSQTIDGATTKALSAQYASIRVMSDGANWFVC